MKPRKRYYVSVHSQVRDRLREEADARGVSVSKLVEAAFAGDLSKLVKIQGADDEPIGPEEPPRAFTCAVCARAVNCVPSLEPFGRNGGMVNVCTTCSTGHPRNGMYTFSEPA